MAHFEIVMDIDKFFLVIQDSGIFNEFAKLIALDLGVEIKGPDGLELLFESLAELDTFRNKRSCVKSGRWFSFQNACQDHFPEFWATRMLLQSLHPEEKSPDDPVRSGKSFADLRKDEGAAGGLKLAVRCCSWETWYSVAALQIGAKPLWKWYSDTIKLTKTPTHNLSRSQSKADGMWMADTQLTKLVETLYNMEDLSMVLEYHQASNVHLGDRAPKALQNFTFDLWYYILGLLGKRGSTLSVFGRPPDCYAMLTDQDIDAQGSFELLQSDWKNLMLLEQSSSPQCSELASDLGLAVSKPMRLIFQLFETGMVTEGKQLLMTVLKRLPDTKVVEDIHQRLRTAANGNANARLGLREVQSLVESSGVLESRKICHPARLDRATFKSRWKGTKARNSKRAFLSGLTKLSKRFSKMMARKSWDTMSEETLSRSSCAWAWMRFYISKRLKDDGISVQELRLASYV